MANEYEYQGLAEALAARGRGGDSMLMHVHPAEVEALERMRPGSITINPDTGMPEAFFWMLPALLSGIAGGIGTGLTAAGLPALGLGTLGGAGGVAGALSGVAGAIGAPSAVTGFLAGAAPTAAATVPTIGAGTSVLAGATPGEFLAAEAPLLSGQVTGQGLLNQGIQQAIQQGGFGAGGTGGIGTQMALQPGGIANAATTPFAPPPVSGPELGIPFTPKPVSSFSPGLTGSGRASLIPKTGNIGDGIGQATRAVTRNISGPSGDLITPGIKNVLSGKPLVDAGLGILKGAGKYAAANPLPAAMLGYGAIQAIKGPPETQIPERFRNRNRGDYLGSRSDPGSEGYLNPVWSPQGREQARSGAEGYWDQGDYWTPDEEYFQNIRTGYQHNPYRYG